MGLENFPTRSQTSAQLAESSYGAFAAFADTLAQLCIAIRWAGTIRYRTDRGYNVATVPRPHVVVEGTSRASGG